MSSKSVNWKRARKRKLYRSQKGKCKYCGCNLPMAAATIDHVVPKALGGSGLRENLALACLDCNRKKGCKAPHVWYMELMTEKAA